MYRKRMNFFQRLCFWFPRNLMWRWFTHPIWTAQRWWYYVVLPEREEEEDAPDDTPQPNNYLRGNPYR